MARTWTHAGGVDLKFPHHDNELAQSEFTMGTAVVNYFFHAGHLSIKGLKMSKSLKNFITIRQALSKTMQIRLMFLLQHRDKPMSYSDETMDDEEEGARVPCFFGRVKQMSSTPPPSFAGTAARLAPETKPAGRAEIGWRNKGAPGSGLAAAESAEGSALAVAAAAAAAAAAAVRLTATGSR